MWLIVFMPCALLLRFLLHARLPGSFSTRLPNAWQYGPGPPISLFFTPQWPPSSRSPNPSARIQSAWVIPHRLLHHATHDGPNGLPRRRQATRCSGGAGGGTRVRRSPGNRLHSLPAVPGRSAPPLPPRCGLSFRASFQRRASLIAITYDTAARAWRLARSSPSRARAQQHHKSSGPPTYERFGRSSRFVSAEPTPSTRRGARAA
jgi:hypothetical protein